MMIRAAALWPLRVAALCVVLGLAAAPAQSQRQLVEPESATARQDGAVVRATRHMIVAANPHASAAGREMLRAGGSATDAAIAAQWVLGLVEPQSSGLGGGAFLLHWDAATRARSAYDGRETAPAAAKPGRFLIDGRPLAFQTAVKSGLSIATPGLVRLLWEVHQAHGTLPWAQLFEPALRLADDGFAVSPRLAGLLANAGASAFDPVARRYFFDAAGRPHAAGVILKNPDYATTLRAIAATGPDGFYRGPVAEAMVAAVKAAPQAAGDLTLQDLAAYRVERRDSPCITYRAHKVCGFGPPSSGGLAVAQVLQLIEPFDLGTGPGDALNARAVHLIAEAEKLAFADRNRYVADPAFVPLPSGLLDPAYMASRRVLIDATTAMPPPPPGLPPGLSQRSFAPDTTRENDGTSHISVIDAAGNAVALTSTIEGAFGSGVMAAGLLLNNELTDFAFAPTSPDGRPLANRIEPGKRPRSTMAPTFVFAPDGRLKAVLGSPGGGRIVSFVVKALVGLIDWRLDPYAAAALTNFGSMGGPLDLELDGRTVLLGLALKAYGHRIRPDTMSSGLNILQVLDGTIEGGSDPRREGVALGD